MHCFSTFDVAWCCSVAARKLVRAWSLLCLELRCCCCWCQPWLVRMRCNVLSDGVGAVHADTKFDRKQPSCSAHDATPQLLATVTASNTCHRMDVRYTDRDVISNAACDRSADWTYNDINYVAETDRMEAPQTSLLLPRIRIRLTGKTVPLLTTAVIEVTSAAVVTSSVSNKMGDDDGQFVGMMEKYLCMSFSRPICDA